MTVTRALGRRLRARPRSTVTVGAIFLVVLVAVGVLLYVKPQFMTWFQSGRTITAEFSQNYHLTADKTPVKVAGLDVGVVTGIEDTDHDTVLVSMKVDESALDTLGPVPSALVTPMTILGGRYGVELKRGGGQGGFAGSFIPRERTATPVELDRILEALPAPTRESLQHTVTDLDQTLGNGGRDALRDLVSDAPSTLGPGGDVLGAAQGTRPGVDLPQIVTNLETVARTLSVPQGQLTAIIADLHDTTAVLAAQSRPLAQSIDALPATLRATRAGVTDLGGTLDKLTATAPTFRPAAQQLDPLLRQLTPVLASARPLVADLRPLLQDARPTVDELVPLSQRGTQVLNDLAGPVLQRVNGPITSTVLQPWQGSGPYKDSGAGPNGPVAQRNHKFYEELGYLVANLDRGSMTQDAQGSMLGFQVGVSPATLAGVPLTLDNLISAMTKVPGGSR